MHLPVLLDEIISCLKPKPGDVILDATLGGGGHAMEILRRILPAGRLIGVDSDPLAIEKARQRLNEFDGAVIFINDDFRNITRILETLKVIKLNGIVFDLGFSSFQLDNAERGFSFLNDGPLDMRFNPKGRLAAKDIVNSFSKDKIQDILREYGEERYARVIAQSIVAARKEKEITRTCELKDVVVKAVGRKYFKQKIHPACRTFQALRIFVNDELAQLKTAIQPVVGYLCSGGRICVISFHSLEDRIVKNVFREMSKGGEVRVITKKPIIPTSGEVRNNPRSRSAKLRVAERV